MQKRMPTPTNKKATYVANDIIALPRPLLRYLNTVCAMNIEHNSGCTLSPCVDDDGTKATLSCFSCWRWRSRWLHRIQSEYMAKPPAPLYSLHRIEVGPQSVAQQQVTPLSLSQQVAFLFCFNLPNILLFHNSVPAIDSLLGAHSTLPQ